MLRCLPPVRWRIRLRPTCTATKPHSSRRSSTANALLLAADDPPSSSSASAGSNPPPSRHLPPPKMKGEDEYVSDREWELRTGRAIDVLQQTLPTFFNTGLVATNYHLPLHIHSLLGATHKGKGRADEQECEKCDEEGIYARTIRLEYTPPVALPAPLPRLLRVEGLPLYVASSVFLRHGMHALYTDLAVAIRKVQIHFGKSRVSTSSDSAPSPVARNEARDSEDKQRERAITISLLVSGISRLGLSKESAEWDVTSTYIFSPRTGRISLHTVNAIHPAPSETVYAAFQSVMSTLSSGFGAGDQKGALNVARGKISR
ncbi:hypothetical protein ACEPAF_5771 [Sanghuangporus sanghuang]